MISKSFLINFTCVAILSEIAYNIYRRFRTKPRADSLTYALMKCYNITNYDGRVNKVLFFPDTGISCRRALSGRICKDKNCHGVHEATSLTSLLNVIKSVKKKLDVCVFMITCGILGDALVECLERGVFVRVVTEERNSGEEGEMTGAQVGKLRSGGVPVRCSNNSFWMHHKFLIADDEILVNGSFNWTNQAILGNYENLIITNDREIVQPFVQEFIKLWNKLAPIDFQEN